MENQLVLVLDFGGQYNQLIARRVRECNVYCEVHPYTMTVEKIKELSPVGIIFTGGPNSVYLENAPKIDPAVFEAGIPVLGICYGIHVMAHTLKGEVAADNGSREYGKTPVKYKAGSVLFKGLGEDGTVWMSHGDSILKLPHGFEATAATEMCPVAAMENAEKKLYGVQFHPEVLHTENGTEIIRNFLYNVCGCAADWTMEDYSKTVVEEIKKKTAGGRVLLALSGGVDSSVAAALLKRAVGSQLTCIYVDALMRKNEGDEVEKIFGGGEIDFVRVRAEDRFLEKLRGVEDPESKRKIIGGEFIRVFEEEAKKIGKVDFLVQGTIYPDVIESGLGDAAVIKSHHNVGGLPDHVDFKEIIEPLSLLFKDEVRQLGRELGLPETVVMRQPFPGPGLSVRVIGEVTAKKLEILREADFIFRDEIAKAGLEYAINQYFAVLTSMRSVGVMGDGRTYDYTLALRGVTTTDFMTADWARIPYDVLDKVSVRIVNEVKLINRIVYDITSKPPATIEWE
jgi:GMP synthase (glutamine-hydrolysing)